MNHQPEGVIEDAVITLLGEDGRPYRCQLLDIFEFEEQAYGLLLRLAEEGFESDDAGSVVVMRLVAREGGTIFQTIESDEEFERVIAYVKALAGAQG